MRPTAGERVLEVRLQEYWGPASATAGKNIRLGCHIRYVANVSMPRASNRRRTENSDDQVGWSAHRAIRSRAHTGRPDGGGPALHAGAWFSGELWGDDLADMSPANSALWLSVDSFGVPLIVVGLMVLWLDRRGITPPPFIAWTLGIWTVVDAVILLFTPWPILLLANILLFGRGPPGQAPRQPHAGPFSPYCVEGSVSPKFVHHPRDTRRRSARGCGIRVFSVTGRLFFRTTPVCSG